MIQEWQGGTIHSLEIFCIPKMSHALTCYLLLTLTFVNTKPNLLRMAHWIFDFYSLVLYYTRYREHMMAQ